MTNILLGNDVSEFQGQINWDVYSQNSNFCLIKASEGVGYIDKWFGNNRNQARLHNLLRGFYHFARPDLGNSPEAEAKFFCNLVYGSPLQEGEIVALDFEVEFKDTVNWCKTWLDTVSSHFNGLKPLIYLNQNLVTSLDWTPIINAGYGLWIAGYTYDPRNNNVQIGKWPFAAIQQWTDKQNVAGILTFDGVDGDVFFGDTEAFKAYGYHTITSRATSQPIPPLPPINQTATNSLLDSGVNTLPIPNFTPNPIGDLASTTPKMAPKTVDNPLKRLVSALIDILKLLYVKLVGF